MEDTIIVRPAMPIQRCGHNTEVTVSERLPVALSEEDYTNIQEIIGEIDNLRTQFSANNNWRQEAENDYIRTRGRLEGVEMNSNKAVCAAIDAGNMCKTANNKVHGI